MPANRVLAHAQHGGVPEPLIAVRHAAVVGQVSSLVPPLISSQFRASNGASDDITVRWLFAESQQRVQSRFELERLSERDLADMKLTRLEIFDETQKPFWQE
jgi:uncharacterized protein YjiS (DUF1127 family)